MNGRPMMMMRRNIIGMSLLVTVRSRPLRKPLAAQVEKPLGTPLTETEKMRRNLAQQIERYPLIGQR